MRRSNRVPQPFRIMRGILPASCLAAVLCLPAHPAAEAGPEPTPRPLRLSAQGAFDVEAARTGDTVFYRLSVQWEDVPAAVMLLPLDRLETPGFHSAGASTSHRKTVAEGRSTNVTEYVFALVAREPGTARVAPFVLRYRNGLTGRDEAVNVPGAAIDITPARAPLARRASFRVALLLAVATALAFATGRLLRARKRATTPAAPETAIGAEIALLRKRCESADFRAWATDAERLCTRFLCRRLGVGRPENVRFEAALDQYLSRPRDIGPEERAGWEALRELFHEARYAGPRRDPDALREACRHLKNCLNPSEGIEHGQPVTA